MQGVHARLSASNHDLTQREREPYTDSGHLSRQVSRLVLRRAQTIAILSPGMSIHQRGSSLPLCCTLCHNGIDFLSAANRYFFQALNDDRTLHEHRNRVTSIITQLSTKEQIKDHPSQTTFLEASSYSLSLLVSSGDVSRSKISSL